MTNAPKIVFKCDLKVNWKGKKQAMECVKKHILKISHCVVTWYCLYSISLYAALHSDQTLSVTMTLEVGTRVLHAT
jgi:hypothetical protein